MLHLHSFIKWKYNHTRSTHCSALLKMLINEPSHANGFFKKEKKNNWKTNSQINHKTHFFKTCMCYTVKCCFIGGNRYQEEDMYSQENDMQMETTRCITPTLKMSVVIH